MYNTVVAFTLLHSHNLCLLDLKHLDLAINSSKLSKLSQESLKHCLWIQRFAIRTGTGCWETLLSGVSFTHPLSRVPTVPNICHLTIATDALRFIASPTRVSFAVHQFLPDLLQNGSWVEQISIRTSTLSL